MTITRILLNLWRYGRSPASALKALRALRDYRYISHSEFFDRTWVERQCVGMRQNGADPVLACLADGVDPSRDFSCREYLALHGIQDKGVNALVHYERVGKRRGYAISYLDQKSHAGMIDGIEDHLKLDSSFIDSIHQKVIQRIREKRMLKCPIRVVFVVFNASMFPGRPLFDAMLSDAVYEPKLAVVPNLLIPRDPQQAVRNCKKELQKVYTDKVFLETEKNGMFVDCLEGADIVCFPSPYDCSYFKYDVRWALYREALPIYFNYSYVVANFSVEVFRQGNFAYFWKVFFEHSAILDDYRRVSINEGANGALVGCLKMDAFLRRQDGARPRSRRKMIVIAPHHSFKGGHNDYLQISNFLRYAGYFQELPKRFPEVDFVFRPHPYFRSALSKDSVWGRVRTDTYFDRLLANSNVSLSTESNYLDLFARSDGMIQDCGSFLVEYFYTGKPQCYLLRSSKDAQRAFTSFGLSCLEHCYQAFSEDEIDQYIRDVVVNGNDLMREKRNTFCQEVMLNYPNVVKNVLAHITRALSSS